MLCAAIPLMILLPFDLHSGLLNHQSYCVTFLLKFFHHLLQNISQYLCYSRSFIAFLRHLFPFQSCLPYKVYHVTLYVMLICSFIHPYIHPFKKVLVGILVCVALNIHGPFHYKNLKSGMENRY